jgi:uncharacterized membrane protein
VAAGAGDGAILGAVLGIIGGVVGCFSGFQARTRLVKALRTPDIYVALIEDILAIAAPVGRFAILSFAVALRRRLRAEKNFPRTSGRAGP